MNAYSVFGFLGIVCVLPALSPAASIVLPIVAEHVEGNSNLYLPFNPQTIESARLQQVYDGTAFATLGSELHIQTIAFRRDDLSADSGFESVLPNVRITLSTTHRSVDALDGSWSENTGFDALEVHSGELHLSSAQGGTPPHAFDILIPLQHAFTYRPADGNLLLDIMNFGGGSTTYFDAHEVDDDGVSRVFTDAFGDVSAPIGRLDSVGLVTQFEFISVPTPSSGSLADLPPNPVPGVMRVRVG